MASPSTELVDVSDLTGADWQAFHAWRNGSDIYDSPMFEPELTRLVASVRPDVKVLKISENGEVCGYWPLLVRPFGWARPVLGPFADWCGPILSPDRIGALAPEDILEQSDLAGGTFPSIPTPLVRQDHGADDYAAMVDLRAGWEAYEEAQRTEHPKFFKKIRRLERKLDREVGEVRFVLECDDDKVFSWLLETKAQQFEKTGLHNVLKADWAQAFLHQLRALKTDRFSTKLSALYAGDRVIAAEFNMWSDKVSHGWLTAYDADYYSYSPGHLISVWILQQAALLGCTTSDWGPGHFSYKRFVMNATEPISHVSLSSPDSTRIAAGLWRQMETIGPEKATGLLRKIRRRSDQICASEPNLTERVAGHVSAVLRYSRR